MFPHLCASVSRLRLQKHCSRSRHLHPGPTVGGDNRDTGLCDTRLKATFRRTRRRLVFVRRRMVQGRGRFKKRENNPWSIPPPFCPPTLCHRLDGCPALQVCWGSPFPYLCTCCPSCLLVKTPSFFHSPTHTPHCLLSCSPLPPSTSHLPIPTTVL